MVYFICLQLSGYSPMFWIAGACLMVFLPPFVLIVPQVGKWISFSTVYFICLVSHRMLYNEILDLSGDCKITSSHAHLVALVLAVDKNDNG